jgi:hypothetical protein
MGNDASKVVKYLEDPNIDLEYLGCKTLSPETIDDGVETYFNQVKNSLADHPLSISRLRQLWSNLEPKRERLVWTFQCFSDWHSSWHRKLMAITDFS